MTEQVPNLVKADVVARYLGISEWTVLQMARKREIPAVPITNGARKHLWRFRMSDIIRHYEDRTQRPE